MSVDKESLHRLSKAIVDSGRVKSFEEAEIFMKGLHLNVFVGEEIENSSTLQAALVTLLNSGHRTFLGGVHVVTEQDYALTIPWLQSTSLYGICDEMGGKRIPPDENAPSIVIGSVDSSKVTGTLQLQVTFDGWLAGVIEYGDSRFPENDSFPVAGVFAGSLALSEAFLSVWSNNATIGRRKVLHSLWAPGTQENGPDTYLLPSNLWVVGLGHLGQAVLWTLGLLPYSDPHELKLVLQDFDDVASSNLSTSLLTTGHAVGWKKTRWVAEHCERRGFRTSIVERKFQSGLVLHEEEPEVCLFLPDNTLARRALQDNPFAYVIEAGLGSKFMDFTDFVIHTFPGEREPNRIWSTSLKESLDVTRLQEGYQKLMHDGLDECGVLTLADTAVGASFVGAATACYVVSEVIRLLNQGPQYEVIQGNLLDLKYMTAIKKSNLLPPRNFGFTQMLRL